VGLHTRFALLLLLGPALLPGARAQSTDGYHAIQVLPVVVDTDSFTQRFVFRNPDESAPLTVVATFYPADGTAERAVTPEGVECPPLLVPAAGQASLASLRALCPGLSAGSAFGMLLAHSGSSRPFALFSRVSNAAGSGFSVEAFAASEFTVSASVVTGLRRSVATGTTPAYQSNCFVGMAPRLETPFPAEDERDVRLTVRDAGGTIIGSSTLHIGSGRLVRLLDVFAAVGAAPGDIVDATATISLPPGTVLADDGEPPLVGFCTVQDNTSFGADFRIAKQEINGFGMLGGMRSSALRDPFVLNQVQIPGIASAPAFSIPPGATRNVHLLYLRQPDFISCFLAPPLAQAVPAYGLEMRLSHKDDFGGWRVVAGGNDAVAFGDVYLGDRAEHFESAYLIEVESNGQNQGQDRPYAIRCRSGSGHSRFEQVLTGAASQF
jgi:hypothetical protein